MDHFAMKWYEDQQKKKEKNYENSQISLLNRHLQNILHQIKGEIKTDVYQVQVSHVNRKLSYCDVWNIGYLNNLENKEIVVEQGVFITVILHFEESIKNRVSIQQDVDRFMRQFGNVDWGMYGEYGRRKQIIQRLKEKERDLKRVY